MEYMFKKANRTLNVERGDLEQERMQIQSTLSRNVRKIDSTLKKMDGMRSEKRKWDSDLRHVTKRLTFEKDCVEQRLLFQNTVRFTSSFLSHLYLIPFFLNGI
jgi:hypothetical protein